MKSKSSSTSIGEDPSPASSESNGFHHVSVLPSETLEALKPAPGKIIVDGTLGAGGHSEALLEAGATVIGLDQDPEALQAASHRLQRFGSQFRPIAANFREIPHVLEQLEIPHVDGILLDIGVSSHQIDTAIRGFSFQQDGPLDMRMNPNAELSAEEIINGWSERDLSDLFFTLGEEPGARRVAKAVVQAREKSALTRTLQLADVISKVLPRIGKQHPATRCFQALRIEVNDELGALKQALAHSPRNLREGGRLAVISFHSLEDRIVKHFLKKHSQKWIDDPTWPAPRPNPHGYFQLIHPGGITADEAELHTNPRARSARLRIGERNSTSFVLE